MTQFYKTHQAYYVFSEYCNGGDLSQFLNARGSLCYTQEESRLILSKIVRGLEDLHTCGIVHRDLKLPNLLIHFKTPMKIGDMELTNEDFISFEKEEMEDFLS